MRERLTQALLLGGVVLAVPAAAPASALAPPQEGAPALSAGEEPVALWCPSRMDRQPHRPLVIQSARIALAIATELALRVDDEASLPAHLRAGTTDVTARGPPAAR